MFSLNSAKFLKAIHLQKNVYRCSVCLAGLVSVSNLIFLGFSQKKKKKKDSCYYHFRVICHTQLSLLKAFSFGGVNFSKNSVFSAKNMTLSNNYKYIFLMFQNFKWIVKKPHLLHICRVFQIFDIPISYFFYAI